MKHIHCCPCRSEDKGHQHCIGSFGCSMQLLANPFSAEFILWLGGDKGDTEKIESCYLIADNAKAVQEGNFSGDETFWLSSIENLLLCRNNACRSLASSSLLSHPCRLCRYSLQVHALSDHLGQPKSPDPSSPLLYPYPHTHNLTFSCLQYIHAMHVQKQSIRACPHGSFTHSSNLRNHRVDSKV